VWRATFEVPALTGAVVSALTEALVRINCAWLRAEPSPPRLYSSAVRYRREPTGKEKWLSIPLVLARGQGDCEDLCAWRAAELQVLDEEPATVVWRRRQTPRGALFHILVRRADGSIEDPSRILGM
jgi:hypothetical protein